MIEDFVEETLDVTRYNYHNEKSLESVLKKFGVINSCGKVSFDYSKMFYYVAKYYSIQRGLTDTDYNFAIEMAKSLPSYISDEMVSDIEKLRK